MMGLFAIHHTLNKAGWEASTTTCTLFTTSSGFSLEKLIGGGMLSSFSFSFGGALLVLLVSSALKKSRGSMQLLCTLMLKLPPQKKRIDSLKKKLLIHSTNSCRIQGQCGEENGLKRRVPSLLAHARLCWFLMCTRECHHKEEQGEGYDTQD